MVNKKKILFLGQLPRRVSPSQRFRIEQWEPLLKEAGYTLAFEPFISAAARPYLYRPGHLLRKAGAVLDGYRRRFGALWRHRDAAYIFVQREAAPLGPPLFEWLWSRVLRRRLIYDFDDAVWIPNTSEANRLAASFKWFGKIRSICRYAWRISAGNDYLASWAGQFNSSVQVVPTVVDTEGRYRPGPAKDGGGRVSIGWTGSHSTLPYLDELLPVLQRLEGEYPFELVVIADRPPAFHLSSLRFLPWREESEIEDLRTIDIGLMPLPSDAWSEGKCGFKLIQYGALGIPSLASDVGVNGQVVVEGETGFLCRSAEDWEAHLRRLLEDAALRRQMGAAARQHIDTRYSLRANSANFLSLFT